MAIAPINYATIQRTADIETFKTSRIQNRWWISRIFRCRWITGEDVLHHQVIHPEENEQLDNHTDAREEGKNKYKNKGSVRKKQTRKRSGRVAIRLAAVLI